MTERLLTKIDTLKQRLGAGTAAIHAGSACTPELN